MLGAAILGTRSDQVVDLADLGQTAPGADSPPLNQLTTQSTQPTTQSGV